MFWGKKKKSGSRRKASKSKSGHGKRKPFGGYSISFDGRKETVEQIFGKGKITPSQMTKKLWKFVKANRLSSRE